MATPRKSTSKKPKSSPLDSYTRKRDLTQSPEPAAKVAKPTKQRIFVIQQHQATRLHWDFRIEEEGVLKSWAVTKEPTMDPSIKRLAVRVEDHPLAYATFAGDIPSGYGKGHVDIWDHGTYEPKGDVMAGLEFGTVEVNLHGDKLHGMFTLVRMGPPSEKENWLLIKMKQEYTLEEIAYYTEEMRKNPRRRGAKLPAKKADKSKASPAAPKPKAAAPKAKAAAVKVKVAKPEKKSTKKNVEFTHLDKMLFPEAELTKGDVLKYYAAVVDRLIPFLKDRPITLERLPDGLATPKSPRFWQKNTPAYYPDWIARAKLKTVDDGKPVEYALVNDADTLLYLVNQGAMTFHPFLSRVQSLDTPDVVFFDLDPGDAPFSAAVTIAKKLHDLLDAAGIEPLVKTSGKSGLHVLTKWTQKGGYDAAREWAIGIAREATEALPKIATMERSIAKRAGRVYVDVMQNGLGKHIVPPYTMRAVPAATVSTPLAWSEVTAKLDPKMFTTAAVLKRLAKQKVDPMASLLE